MRAAASDRAPGTPRGTFGILAVVAILAIVATGCDVPGGPGERVRGGGFELRCDPGCGPGGDELLEALIQTRDSVTHWLGADAAGSGAPGRRILSRPLRIRLYASPASFRRADERLASGRFSEQQAFSHARTRTAHILAEGTPDPRRWRRFGPGFQGQRLVVHEAAHLVTYTLAEDARWPLWVSEGLAAHAEEQWARSTPGGRVSGESVQEPWLHTQRFLRQRLVERGEFPTPAEIVRGQTGAQPLGTRYAIWSLFMGVLLEPPFRETTRTLLATLAGSPPAGGWGREEVARRFDALFGPEEQRAMEARMTARIEAAPVRWVELRRSAGWTPEGLLQIPVSTAPFLWHPAPSADEGGGTLRGIVLRGEVERLGGASEGSDDRGDLVLALGQEGEGGDVVGVRIPAPGTGEPEPVRVSLRAYARLRALALEPIPSPESLDSLASRAEGVGEDAGAPAGAEFTFELRWGDGVLSLRVGSLPPQQWRLDGAGPSGGWGVGSTGTEAVLWRTLDVTPE